MSELQKTIKSDAQLYSFDKYHNHIYLSDIKQTNPQIYQAKKLLLITKNSCLTGKVMQFGTILLYDE